MPMTADETRRRLGVAQIEALFGSVPVGVGAAAVASVILAAGMGSLGFVELWTGVAWVGYLQVCALCKLTLRLLYQRSRPRADQWRVWALWFTAINFAGGIGFGWAPLGLTIGGRLDVIDLFPNTIYGVSLDALAFALCGAQDEYGTRTCDGNLASASAAVDPAFMIDSGFADAPQYQIVFSPGVAPAVPESGTWAMMLIGFAGLGYAALRRPTDKRGLVRNLMK